MQMPIQSGYQSHTAHEVQQNGAEAEKTLQD